MAKPIPTSEYEGVVAAVEQYCQGLKAGSSEETAKAFHKDAIMYGFATKTDLLGGPISNLWEFIKTYGAAPNINYRIDVLAITPCVSRFAFRDGS
jgi:hypothetical protein